MALSPQERSRRMRLNMLMAMSYAVAGRSAFTPLSLFSAGEQGAWYDPSDFSTMFQDSAGTTPVTAVEQPVGLILDKSKSLAVGSEMIANGTFDSTTTGWTARGSATLASVSGELSVTAGSGTGGADQVITTVAGNWYRVTATIRNGNGTDVRVRAVANAFNGTVLAESTAVTSTSATSVTLYFAATTTSTSIYLRLASLVGNVGYFDNISVKEIAGNHASQTTSTSRPVLSARVNLLTNTEDFSVAAWIKTGATASANKIVETTATSIHAVTQGGTPASTSTYSVKLKAAERSFALVGNTSTAISVNLTSGAVTTAAGSPGNVSSTNAGDGWWRVSFTTASEVYIYVSQDGVFANRSYTGTAGSGIFAKEADFRSATAGSSLPPYQRVGAATAGTSSAAGTGDYDTTGFPYYLSFDGTDDSLVSSSMDFTNTDKMTVFAGVRKLSDALDAIIAECSTSSTVNAGSFLLIAANASGANYGFRSRGSASVSILSTPANYASPITNVITCQGNISGDTIVIRANGSQVASDTTTDQGTGNYGNYAIYIGRRGNNTLPLNGRIYGLIIRGAQTDATTITNAETWLNNKTKAF